MRKDQLREEIARILINGKKDMCEANVILREIMPFDEVSKGQVKKFVKIAKQRCKDIH